MKERINKRIQEEYETLYDEMVAANKKAEAIGRSKFINRVGNALLLGMVPAAIIAVILSFIYRAGLISAPTLSLLSAVGTVASCCTALGLFEKKWEYKKELKDYNIPKSEEEKLEQQLEADEVRRKKEVQTNLLKDYYNRINADNFEFINEGYNEEIEESILEKNKEKLEKAVERQFVNDKFGEYRSGRKSPFKSTLYGMACGFALSLAVLYLPQLIGGVGIMSLATSPATSIITLLTTAAFGTYAGIESNRKLKLYKKKNKALGSRALPEGTDYLYMENHNLVSAEYNKCLDTMTRIDSCELPVTKKEVEVEETYEPTHQLVKEDIVTLSKKIEDTNN